MVPKTKTKMRTRDVNENYSMLRIEVKMQRGAFRGLFPEDLVGSMQRVKTRLEPDSGHHIILAELYAFFCLAMNMWCAWHYAASTSDSGTPQLLSSRSCFEQPVLQRKH